ncbi:MAG: DUF1697 domain-containing protein [Patescibacteria group bacterium]
MTAYVALLRGINVGGNNMIKMADLKACFEAQDFTNVTTYIQSGNVVFQTKESDPQALEGNIEKIISAGFAHYKAKVVLRSTAQMKQIVDEAPKGFGQEPTNYRYDILFLKEPLTPKEALSQIPLDEVFAGKDVVYFSRLIAKATQSRISRMVMLPVYQQMTIRNWNTTTKLQKMMDTFDELTS